MDIVVSDLEGTLTTGATWRGLGDYLKRHRSALAYALFFLSRLPLVPLARSNLIDQQSFKARWIKDELRLFTQATREDVAHMAQTLVDEEMWPRRRLEVLAELAGHRAAGARLIIATGTYQPIAAAFASRIDAEAVGTPLAYDEDGILTGLASPVSVRHEKADNLREHINGDGQIVAAYGDTDSDVYMLELSANPVAVYPSPRLRRVAEQRGWRIIDG